MIEVSYRVESKGSETVQRNMLSNMEVPKIQIASC